MHEKETIRLFSTWPDLAIIKRASSWFWPTRWRKINERRVFPLLSSPSLSFDLFGSLYPSFQPYSLYHCFTSTRSPSFRPSHALQTSLWLHRQWWNCWRHLLVVAFLLFFFYRKKLILSAIKSSIRWLHSSLFHIVRIYFQGKKSLSSIRCCTVHLIVVCHAKYESDACICILCYGMSADGA